MTRRPIHARTFAEWAIEQMVARYSLGDADPVVPLVPMPRGDVHTAFGRFARAQPSGLGLLDPHYSHFLMPTAGSGVLPWLPSPRQAVRTLPARLDVVVDAFGYDHAGRPAVMPPARPLVRITEARHAHWRSFVRFFGPRCEFALHTAAAGRRRTPVRCR